ncbi:MAG: hypothetical protein LBB61_04005 [Treponema sp.]|nr:hypothetical protein [Treponema sp.]
MADETVFARGVTAQRIGTMVEAMSYCYETVKFDSGLAEAVSLRFRPFNGYCHQWQHRIERTERHRSRTDSG